MGIEGGKPYNPVEAIQKGIDTARKPNPEGDNGSDDADTANAKIFCPNPDLGIVEFCDPDNEVPDLSNGYEDYRVPDTEPRLEYITPLLDEGIPKNLEE